MAFVQNGPDVRTLLMISYKCEHSKKIKVAHSAFVSTNLAEQRVT
jgi:hypothetical protein